MRKRERTPWLATSVVRADLCATGLHEPSRELPVPPQAHIRAAAVRVKENLPSASRGCTCVCGERTGSCSTRIKAFSFRVLHEANLF